MLSSRNTPQSPVLAHHTNNSCSNVRKNGSDIISRGHAARSHLSYSDTIWPPTNATISTSGNRTALQLWLY